MLRDNAEQLAATVSPGDVVIIHDPQPAGLAAAVKGWGLPVVWRCHVGVDDDNEYTDDAWEFLRPYLEPYVDAYVFTRAEYAPDWVPADRLHVIKPSIDPLSPKNQLLSPETTVGALDPRRASSTALGSSRYRSCGRTARRAGSGTSPT